jgi:hypothetical protein
VSFRLMNWAALSGNSDMMMSGQTLAEATLPLSLRRRATPLGHRALRLAVSLLPQDSPPDAPVRFIFSSRHGEYSRTMGLLRSLAANEDLSPAEFSMAVHHGLAGLLSIHTGNHEGHVAVAAGAESFGYGLFEAAVTCLDDDRPVLLLHFDQALPECYDALDVKPSAETILALMLHPSSGEALQLEITPTALQPLDKLPDPSDLAAEFLAFIRSSASAARANGGRMMWHWSRCV